VVTGDELDLGGEPACLANLFDLERPDIRTRGDVEQLVVDFYRDVAMDDLLGPIFAAARVDWSVHIPRLVDFWAWQLLDQPGYGRNPLRAHEPVHDRTPFGAEHYLRWLDLFETTVDESFAGPTAEMAKARARKMAAALRRLLDGVSAPADDAIVAPMIRAQRVQDTQVSASGIASRRSAGIG
jgi:hemoglobin